jgi:hypothetical protein
VRVCPLISGSAWPGQARMSWRLALGYHAIARRPIVQFPRCPHAGDWVLMKKEFRLNT